MTPCGPVGHEEFMLTFEQIKAIEAALGPEAAKPVVEAISSTDTRVMASLMAEIATKEDMTKLRGEFKEELAHLKGELKEDLANLKGEFKQDLAKFKGEMREELAGLKGDFKEELTRFKGEYKEEIATLRGETREDSAHIRGDIKRLEMQIRLLLILAVLAIAMFSPNLAALLKLAR